MRRITWITVWRQLALKEPVKLSVLLNLSAITLTCFVTRELKSCQDLVILPALNTDGRDPSKSATPKKMLSASSAQQVALIGSCTYPSLVNLSL